MEPYLEAFAQTISTSVTHVVRTTVVRNDLIGWVTSGHKRLVGPTGELKITSGRIFILPRLTEWDFINEVKPGGCYEARVIGFSPSLIEEFHEQFGQFSAVPAVQGCASSTADEIFATTFAHAFAALADNVTTNAICKHRALEVLLMLAERGLVFAASKELGWAERIRRLMSQRPQANWTLDEVANVFHQSSSTLQRRLASESASFTQCLREVRLETAMALLQDSRLQVAEVAARCGYDSHSRFSAAFRKRYGYAPSHLRP